MARRVFMHGLVFMLAGMFRFLITTQHIISALGRIVVVMAQPQSDSRQGQNTTTRAFGEANANCAEQLLRSFASLYFRRWEDSRFDQEKLSV
jgi:hypothetical protein